MAGPPTSGTSGRRLFTCGPDGYPARIIDPTTGDINQNTLGCWKEHYDLAAILERNWATLGPKLEGKLHRAVGDGDTYYLNSGVHALQNQLEATRNPHLDATFQYGRVCRAATPAARRTHHAAEQLQLGCSACCL